MTDEELIEKIEEAIREEVYDPRNDNPRKIARAALAVFREHTEPTTDDERQTLIDLKLATFGKRMSDGYMSLFVRDNEEAADLVIEAGFRRGAPAEPTSTDVEYVRGGVCLLCGDGVLNSGEHIDPERHAEWVAKITSGAPAEPAAVEVTAEMLDRAARAVSESESPTAFDPEGFWLDESVREMRKARAYALARIALEAALGGAE